MSATKCSSAGRKLKGCKKGSGTKKCSGVGRYLRSCKALKKSKKSKRKASTPVKNAPRRGKRSRKAPVRLGAGTGAMHG